MCSSVNFTSAGALHVFTPVLGVSILDSDSKIVDKIGFREDIIFMIVVVRQAVL